ncbi:hypothetical protein H4R35_006014, partial [Dimargaris xerosporica]
MVQTRRRQKPKAKVSTAHYVGYVEDDESVEAIMKKFEELERIQSQFAHKTPDSLAETTTTAPEANSSQAAEPTATDDAMDVTSAAAGMSEGTMAMLSPSGTTIVMGLAQGDAAPPPLTQEQLEEVFKQTSSFTLKSANMSIEDCEDPEWWRVEMADGATNEFYEEDDYIAIDDSFWDEEFGTVPKKRGRRVAAPREREPRRPRHDKESIIQRYRVMQVKLQDKHGNHFFIRKRVSTVDPSLPTYVRIPAAPIPRSWVFQIQERIDQIVTSPSTRQIDASVLQMDLLSLGQAFQAVYMDPPLLLPGEAPSPHKVTLEQLARLPIGDLTPNGFLFIWVEKELLPDIIRIAMAWKFKYVENFCWIKKRVNNQIACLPSAYFRKSKLTLLIFRKEGEIDIRHQRSPDSLFDFIKPNEPGTLTERKPQFVYQLIETLLPGAMPTAENPLPDRLLEL